MWCSPTAAANRWSDAYEAWARANASRLQRARSLRRIIPLSRDPRFDGDLGFLGNRLPDREARVEEFFLKPAAALPGMRFLLGGAGWGDKPMTRERQLFRPRLHARPQRLQLHAARGDQHLARQHGALRVLAGHARF